MSAIRKGGVLLTGAAMVALMGGAAMAQNNNTNANGKNVQSTPSDMRFAKEAARGGNAEVQMGQLAVQKASDPQVKQFGQKMIDDHTKANNQLQSIATKDNITLPTGMTARDKATYDSLSKLSGTAFDRAYMRDMVKDHQTDVNEFQQEANNGSNPDLKSFAGSTLSTLQGHLRQARDTDASLTARSSR